MCGIGIQLLMEYVTMIQNPMKSIRQNLKFRFQNISNLHNQNLKNNLWTNKKLKLWLKLYWRI